jgi:hypothetical protein
MTATLTTSINIQSPAFNPFASSALQLPNQPCYASKDFMTNHSMPFEPTNLLKQFDCKDFVPNFTYTDNQ